MLLFGPVPSRRLGRSLGINNIPAKHCSFACVYCQVGHTTKMSISRRSFHPPEEILSAVEVKLEQAVKAGEGVDYLTFVADGEPTLDLNLGRTIELLRGLGPKIAVISNASLIADEGVRAELALADWVSLKCDAVDEGLWHKINRPHPRLSHGQILEGARKFARVFKGALATETLLVAGLNDEEAEVEAVAGYLASLAPETAYLSIPTRPPAERWVKIPAEEVVHRAYRIFAAHLDHPEYLIGYEGNAFAVTSDVEENLLSITAVHPMREDAVAAFLDQAGAKWNVVRDLVERGGLVETVYENRKFYMRAFPRTPR